MRKFRVDVFVDANLSGAQCQVFRSDDLFFNC